METIQLLLGKAVPHVEGIAQSVASLLAPDRMYLVTGDKTRPSGAKRKVKRRKKGKRVVRGDEDQPRAPKRKLVKCFMCGSFDHIPRTCKEACQHR